MDHFFNANANEIENIYKVDFPSTRRGGDLDFLGRVHLHIGIVLAEIPPVQDNGAIAAGVGFPSLR